VSGKQIAAAAGLLVVIVGAIIMIVLRVTSSPPAPEWMEEKMVEKMDTVTGESITKSLVKWQKIGFKGDMYKNPKTGEFTMADPVKCPHCGAKIPAAPMPPMPEDFGEGPVEAQRVMGQWNRERARVAREYACPECGELVHALPKGPGGGRGGL